MMIDWKELAGPVIRIGAPVLGQALAGPFGAMAGKILAEAFGASEATPAAVNDAIVATPNPSVAAEAAQRAESEWLAALAAIGKAQVEQVGETMRAEAESEDLLQRWWRPIYALELSLLECPAFTATLLQALWGGQEATINGFASLSGLLIAYFGARFGVLGIYVNGRSREKEALATGEVTPSILGEILKAVRKKK
jgi:hypothetical protein